MGAPQEGSIGVNKGVLFFSEGKSCTSHHGDVKPDKRTIRPHEGKRTDKLLAKDPQNIYLV